MQKLIVLVILILVVLAGGLVSAQQDAAITISSPAPGAVLPNLNAITITGTGTALFENSLVVQARDSGGQILAQQPVTTDASEVGGTGNWQATLAVSVTPGTAGDIRAFATSANDGSVVAEATINVTYGAAPLPSTIAIDTPHSGEILPNAGSFLVHGSASNIFEGAVTVQVRNAAGNVLAEQGTIASGAGEWEVTLTVNVAAGTTGNIRAFSEAPDGRVDAEAIVNVSFGAIPNDVDVKITFPTNATVVNTSGGVDVTGTTRNIFDANVVVQLRDGNNHVITERSVKSSTTEGEGLWQANLNAYFTSTVNGSIVAFTPGVGDGGQFLSHTVFVTFQANCGIRTDWPIYTVVRGDILNSIARRVGSSTQEIAQGNCLNNVNIIEVGQQIRVPRLPATQPPPATQTPTPAAPQQTAISITSPQNGAALDATAPVSVLGTATGLTSVVVQALDATNNVMAAQTIPVSGGTWQAALSVGAAPDTTGRITAFATSVVDGSVVASASVSVTYGASQPGDVRLDITLPEANTALDLSAPVTVQGIAAGLSADHELRLRVLDLEARVLNEYPVLMNDAGEWSFSLPVEATSGTRGLLYIYAPTPVEGVVVADAINVSFGTPESGPFVTISSPIPYATLPEQTFKIGGRGGSLFEGNVVVRALDGDGNVLVEEPTTLNAAEAGGEGEWEITLLVDTPPGTRGMIEAYSTSAADGSQVALARVPVIFGQPAPDAQSLHLVSPLPDTSLAVGDVMIYGAAGLPIQNVTVQMIDADGNILASRSATVDAASASWQTTLTLVAVDPGTTGRLVAFAIGEGGAVVASDGIAIAFADEPVAAG